LLRRRRLITLLQNTALICSALACLFLLACFPLNATRAWIYYSIYTARPTISDFKIEFGKLYETTPRPPAVGMRSMGGPTTYDTGDSRADFGPAALDDNASRKILWRFAGIRMTEGQIIPPWGWRDRKSLDASLSIRYRVLSIPLPYAVVVTGAAPAIWFIRRTRREHLSIRRSLAGLCVHCGYDLRASHARCPECGTPCRQREPNASSPAPLNHS
jgi:hypothetical protein